MGALTPKQLAFLKAHEVCRLATASKDAKPHVVPVIYALDGEDVIVAVDYGTKKLKNLRENKEVALVIDEYHPNRAVMVEGTCEILERGKEYLRLLRILFDRFETYRKNPWGEGESPILKIRPTKAVSW
ncbi:MAG: pyridoxamine 5'-phosphate oxidase family protein [Nitrososphaerota archaeon]|nr:pyridoxamine 5'-phosphate oxidase family protein [Nitrososphaerota archaeon]MDG6983504.1 pyridoxamine 5'-phosphate oxidase family protein [Nitrososphaerota archaeon]